MLFYAIKYYFMVEIPKRETMSKTTDRCIATFDYFDRLYCLLSVTGSSVSVVSFATVLVHWLD